MKNNSDKCYLIISTDDVAEIQIGDCNKNHEKLLGVKIDNKLNFDDHVKSLCKKASRLARITPYA